MKKRSSKNKAPRVPSILERKDPEYTHFDDYICTQTFRQVPMSEAGLIHLSQTLVEWAKRRDSYRVDDFIDNYGLSPKTFYSWVKRSPALKLANEFALRRIASNREIGALTKQLDSGSFKHMQHRYDEAWREADEYHAKLRVKEERPQESGGFIILKEMPESKLVPIRRVSANIGEDEQ